MLQTIRFVLLVTLSLQPFLWSSVQTLDQADLERTVRSDLQMNRFFQLINGAEPEEEPISLLRSYQPLLAANLELTSPYQVVPGSYQSLDNTHYVGSSSPYSGYSKYLASGAYQYHNKHCLNSYGQLPKISNLDVDNAFGYANHELAKRYPEYANGSHYSGVAHKEVEGRMLELVSEYFGKFKCFSKYQMTTYLPVISIQKNYLKQRNGDISCTPFYNQYYDCTNAFGSKYRTIDGACNNRLHPYWGRSNTCHIRLLPPDYSDGIQGFRMSKTGKVLPNPRDISGYVAESKDFKGVYTGLLLGWGQFVNHDLSFTVDYKSNPLHKGPLDCCKKPDNKCATIRSGIATKYDNVCRNFVRSSPCPLCKLGPRQQMNGQTAFLDASLVYGPTLELAAKLRTFQSGLLKFSLDRFGRPILPIDVTAAPCTPLRKGLKCFIAGDIRVNQHPILLSLHVTLVRNHNHHAIQLKRINPTWNDEQLYQEARRITIAEIQHITFNEYLPVILGTVLSNYYSILPLDVGYTNYEPFTDPSTWNEFVAAASRYGHSQIKDMYKTLAANMINSSMFFLKDNFFEPGFAHDGFVGDVLRGIITEPSNTIDPYYSLTAKNFVLMEKGKKSGLDLVSTNILRGRDHGIPGYVHFLKACFNYDAKVWKDLEKFIPAEILVKLQQVYENIEDLDLYIGGVSERHFIDASIGPTFGCLVGIQFYHIKFGDRYYYEHGGQSGSFTPAQLNNIRSSASMARLLCRNSDNQVLIQPKPFFLPSGFNKLIDCKRLGDLNYLLWKQ